MDMEELRVSISSPKEWGMGERLVPDTLQSDPASQRIKDINIRNYKIASLITEGKRVLDIACGSGYGTNILAEAGADEAIGVDLDSDAIEYARNRYACKNARYIQADAQEYWDAAKFDVIICFETIEHVSNPRGLLEKLHSLMNPRGILALSAPVGETRHIDPYHLHKFSVGSLQRLLNNTGFSPLLTRMDEIYLSFGTLSGWQRSYPEAPSARLSEILLTRRGLRLLRSLLLKGGVRFHQFLVISEHLP